MSNYSARDAAKCGCDFYKLPDELTDDDIDPLLRPFVQKINRSGWVWTAESCQGHPEAKIPAWADNVRPMLRLVTPKECLGRVLGLWVKAMTIPARTIDD